MRSFENDTTINAIIFGNDDSLLPHSDNRKNNFVVLGEGRSFELMEALVHQRRSWVKILVKQTQNFAWV